MDVAFRNDLIDFLQLCHFPPDRMIRLFKDVCFENVRVRIVSSKPGFVPKDEELYGHKRIRSIIRDLNEYYRNVTHHIPRRLPILCQSSTIGILSKDFVNGVVASCYGVDDSERGLFNHMHVIYPSKEYVRTAIMKKGPSRLLHYRDFHDVFTLKTSQYRKYIPTEGRERSLPHSHYSTWFV